MKLNFKIHSKAHILKAALGLIEFSREGIDLPPKELMVVNYHGTPLKFIHAFEEQVLFFKRHFNIIRPEQLDDFYTEGFKSNRPSLLFTFDDGLKNNLHAIKILDKHQLKALFFVIPDFIDTSPELQKDYYLQNIRPKLNSAIESEPEDFTSLSWNEIKSLISEGHKIGSHTSTHSLKSTLAIEKSKYEIIDSKKKIAEKLGLGLGEINAYCSPNNTLFSTGAKEAKLIRAHYKYHFTTFPGSNLEDKNQQFIKRSNIECFWLKGAVLFAIGKLDRKRWKKAIQLYNDMIS